MSIKQTDTYKVSITIDEIRNIYLHHPNLKINMKIPITWIFLYFFKTCYRWR